MSEVNEALSPKSETGRGIVAKHHSQRFRQAHDPTIRYQWPGARCERRGRAAGPWPATAASSRWG
ncbi:hypothetical protein, partial [Burkholderia cepacia]|uniref:hypothetical protein n=1 Tax=Burkholderia cepacia TaxID=292 RepID=UPI001C7216F7